MSSVLDLELSQSMAVSLEYFFTSLKGGNDTLASFLRHWMPLTDTIKWHHDQLNAETLADAHKMVSMISAITSRMLKLDAETDILHLQLVQDLEHVLNDNMEDLVIRDESPILTGHDSAPAYVKPCCQWILANLHNPYPPKSIRNSICRQTGCSARDIDAWFTDARKRMGWNQLRRTHFANKREKILDAATSFFKPRPDLKVNFSVTSELVNSDDHSLAFVEMEELARRLFSDKFEETSLARTIDHVDMRPQPQSQSQSNQVELPIQRTGVSTHKRKRHVYPSPERSPERSFESQSPSIIVIHSPLLPSTPSHKRHRSESLEGFPNEIDSDRAHKRLRPSHTQYVENALAAASLPSPPASLDGESSPATPQTLHIPTLPTSHVVQIFDTVQTTSLNKRKRSSPDSEDQRPSKYIQPASLSRITSNPLLISNNSVHQSSTPDLSLDDLPSQSIPNYISSFSLDPVLDDSAPLEISCFQFPLEGEDVHVHNPMTMPHEITPAFFQKTVDWSGLSTWVDRPQGNSRDVTNSEDSFGLNGQDFIELDINNLFGGLPTVDEIYAPTSALFNDWTTVVNEPYSTDAPSVAELGVTFDNPSSVGPTLKNPTELVAKRERAELLRAELKQLEADIA